MEPPRFDPRMLIFAMRIIQNWQNPSTNNNFIKWGWYMPSICFVCMLIAEAVQQSVLRMPLLSNRSSSLGNCHALICLHKWLNLDDELKVSLMLLFKKQYRQTSYIYFRRWAQIVTGLVWIKFIRNFFFVPVTLLLWWSDF